mgnify:CR=1 FL=1
MMLAASLIEVETAATTAEDDNQRILSRIRPLNDFQRCRQYAARPGNYEFSHLVTEYARLHHGGDVTKIAANEFAAAVACAFLAAMASSAMSATLLFFRSKEVTPSLLWPFSWR